MLSPSARSEVPTGLGNRRARFVPLLLLLALSWACGAPRERFRGAHASPEALTEVFLGALEAEDRPRLQSLALSAQEFQLEVFPEMPVYGNAPPDFAWSQLELRSRHGLSTVLETQGGRAWDLEEIVFRGGGTTYQTFTVHREPMLHLRDRQTGARREMALFGSLLEHDGGYTLFSYNIDR